MKNLSAKAASPRFEPGTSHIQVQIIIAIPVYLIKAVHKKYQCKHIVLVSPVNFPFHIKTCRLNFGLRLLQLAAQSGHCNQVQHYELLCEIFGSHNSV